MRVLKTLLKCIIILVVLFLLSAAESAGAWCEQRQEDLSCQEVWRPAIRGSEEDGGCTEAGDVLYYLSGKSLYAFQNG
jgi:hypothetical protein